MQGSYTCVFSHVVLAWIFMKTIFMKQSVLIWSFFFLLLQIYIDISVTSFLLHHVKHSLRDYHEKLCSCGPEGIEHVYRNYGYFCSWIFFYTICLISWRLVFTFYDIVNWVHGFSFGSLAEHVDSEHAFSFILLC
jgi:hypothetical protein